jgi:hypothetical protein
VPHAPHQHHRALIRCIRSIVKTLQHRQNNKDNNKDNKQQTTTTNNNNF